MLRGCRDGELKEGETVCILGGAAQLGNWQLQVRRHAAMALMGLTIRPYLVKQCLASVNMRHTPASPDRSRCRKCWP